MPVIAIVGRPNVGKSSLLNALVGKRISIVQDMPGVTRDRVSYPLPIEVGGGMGFQPMSETDHGLEARDTSSSKPETRFVELVDTGGYGFVDPDALTDHIRHQIDLAMARANLVLLIVDCQDGLTSVDEEIAALLRHKSIRTVIVANKADNPKADLALGDFARMGLGTPIGISALHGRNVDQVIDAIKANVDLSKAPTDMPEPELLVAIVGKRNSGKSTLVNSIAKLYEGDPERVIVSEVPGTTRDSVDVRFEKDAKALVVIDTAGVRKKRHMVTNDIEFYSFHRAQRSIRRADVVLMLIDGTEPVSEPDKKLASYIGEQFKPVVLVINKWDLTREKIRELYKDKEHVPADTELMEQYREYLDAELRHLDFAPIAFITAKDGKNIQAVLDLAQNLHKQARLRLTTGHLNRVVRQILAERTPSTPSGRRARVYYATQVEVDPPTIVVFVNNVEYVGEQYQRFMINRFRELLPYDEVPIRLIVRPRGEGHAGEELKKIEESGFVDEGADGAARPQRRPRPARAASRARPAHRPARRPATSPKSKRTKKPRR